MPETETKPEIKDGKQPAGAAAGDSAPEKKETQSSGAAGSSGTEKRTDSREPEKKRTFFEKRQERKQSLQEQLASLQQEITSLKQSRQSPASDGRKSILDVEDPDAYLDDRFDGLRKDIEEVKSFKQELQEERKFALKYQAEEYLLTRKHSDDPEFCEEIRNRLQGDPSLRAMSEFDPMRAARSAYIEVCEARGIAPDLSSPSPAGRAAGPKPTTTRSVNTEDRSFNEWQVYVRAAEAGSGEHAKRLNEMRQAQKEGRIK